MPRKKTTIPRSTRPLPGLHDYRDKGKGWARFQNVICVDERDLAICVQFKNGKRVWFPQSTISDDSEVYADSTSGELIVREWIAKQKGLM